MIGRRLEPEPSRQLHQTFLPLTVSSSLLFRLFINNVPSPQGVGTSGNKNSHPSPRRNVGELRGGRSGFPPEADYSGAAASEFHRLAFPLGLGLPLGSSGSHIQLCFKIYYDANGLSRKIWFSSNLLCPV